MTLEVITHIVGIKIVCQKLQWISPISSQNKQAKSKYSKNCNIIIALVFVSESSMNILFYFFLDF